MRKKSYFHMAAILKLKMAASKHIFDGRIRILTTENIKLCENINFLSSLEAKKLVVQFRRGGHFEIQNGDTKLQDHDCYHMKMIYGDTKLTKKHNNPLPTRLVMKT